MKLLHLGDIHLGKSVNEFSMIEDQRYILKKILEMVDVHGVDAVLIAGDVYDRSVPSEEAVKLLDYFLTELVRREKSVFVISGNHDSDERLQFASELLRENHVYIAGRYDGEVECVEMEDEYGTCKVWLLPYIKASRVAHFYPEADTSTYDAAFRTAIAACDVKESERNVILVHQFVTGKSEEPILAGSESASVSVGTVEKIGYDCFDKFDYVAMGHIHGCQAVGRETCRYAGSPLKYSLNQKEIQSQKTVPVITMGEKGNVKVELLPLIPRREVRHMKGTLKDLLANAVDVEDYIYATLTDEAAQFDAMSRLQEVYPNVMKLDYDNTSTRAVQEEMDFADTEGKSFEELMTEFYEWMNGVSPSKEEWDILNEVAKEAGVIL